MYYIFVMLKLLEMGLSTVLLENISISLNKVHKCMIVVVVVVVEQCVKLCEKELGLGLGLLKKGIHIMLSHEFYSIILIISFFTICSSYTYFISQISCGQ